MKPIIPVFFLACLISLAKNNFAQVPDFCATDAKVKEALKNSPEKLTRFLKSVEENTSRDAIAHANGYAASKLATSIYTIPVVFHIIHENGPENISDAQILDAVHVLNVDFRKLNSDTSQIIPSFQTVAADCGIQFKLAQIDPNGNCTNGIDRIYSSQTNIGDDGSKLNPWPYENYFNVWVVKNISPGGIAGYAYYPGTAPFNAEGVIILHNYLGSIGTSSPYTSRVLTHETGHYLNLEHVWGSTNSPGIACGDDGVGDTPITKGWTNCNLNGNFCSPGVFENVQNYMEYSYCNKMFTWGQKARMVTALNSSDGSRNTLWIASNLTATGIDSPVLCTADFSAFPNSKTLCAGESITFKDQSYNGIPTAWTWSFPGGTLVAPSTIHDSIPVVEYANPGVFSVSLTASNGGGSVSVTKPAYVSVNPSTAQFSSNSFIEDFETHTIPGDWKVLDLDGFGNTWQKTSSAHTSGSFAVKLNNLIANAGDADELISPSIDVSAIASPYFTFKYAYAAQSGLSSKLLVYVSPDCGKSWFQRKGISGTALPTAPAKFTPFVPQSNEWKQEVVNIANVLSQANVLIKFKFINEDGNNLYIDDVNIISVLGMNNPTSNQTPFSIAPNPFLDHTLLSLELKEKSLVDIDIYTLTGQKIRPSLNYTLASGTHKIEIKKEADLITGIYFLDVCINKQHFIKKLVVN